MEMSWKERLFRSLPFALVLIAATGIAVTEEIYYAIVALAGVWLLPSPLTATPNVSRETSRRKKPSDHAPEWEARWRENVSRETLPDDNHASEAAVKGYYERTLVKESDLPVPCTLMHGSADDHVLGCEGWTFPR